MIRIDIADKGHALQKLADGLSAKNVTVANVRAINLAIRKANTQYRRLIVSQYNLKYADTKSFTISTNATYSNVQGSISGFTAPISLSRFNPSFYNSNAGKVFTISRNRNKESKAPLVQSSRRENMEDIKGGVSFEIKKGEPQRLPFAFMIEKGPNSGSVQQIFARGKYEGNTFKISKKRNPITALKTVSPFGTLTNPVVTKNTEADATKNMQTEFERQINLLVDKIQP